MSLQNSPYSTFTPFSICCHSFQCIILSLNNRVAGPHSVQRFGIAIDKEFNRSWKGGIVVHVLIESSSCSLICCNINRRAWNNRRIEGKRIVWLQFAWWRLMIFNWNFNFANLMKNFFWIKWINSSTRESWVNIRYRKALAWAQTYALSHSTFWTRRTSVWMIPCNSAAKCFFNGPNTAISRGWVKWEEWGGRISNSISYFRQWAMNSTVT